MDDAEWRRAENDAKFDALLKSILKPQSDLQRNWDVDLIMLCDKFLEKIQHAMHDGISYIDFVEAAMVVQSSAAVYAKKVDYLWVMLEKLLVTFRSSSEDQTPSAEGQEARRRVRRTLRNLVADDYNDVELELPEGKSIDLKVSQGNAVEEFDEANYFIQDLMNNKETGPSTPLFDMHGDMIGYLHDFRMNRRLLNGMWLADSLPVFEQRGHCSHLCVPGNGEWVEAEERELLVATGDRSPCEPTSQPLQELTGPEVERLASPDLRPPTPPPLPPLSPPLTPPPPTPPPSIPLPPSPGQGSDVEISRAAQTRSATRSVNLVDAVLVSEKELNNYCKADIPDKKLVVQMCIHPECVYCKERHERKGRKECCKSEEEIQCCLSGIEAMLLDDVIKPELTKLCGFQFSREFLLGLRRSQIRAIQEPACFADWTSCTLNSLKLMFEDDEEGDFLGFDLNLCEQLFRLNDVEGIHPNMDEGDELDSEEVSANRHEADFPVMQGMSLPVDVASMQDSINSQVLASSSVPEPQPDIWQPDTAANDTDDVESRAARVLAWHDSLRPLLEGAEQRSNVNIDDYSSQVLAAFPSGHLHSTLSLQQILQDKPREDAGCYFLAALMLANDCNVKISKNDDSELAMDCMELTLLKRSRKQELMEEECATITTSDRSRKRRKAAPAVSQKTVQPQNSMTETALRESPNRINIMSKRSACQLRKSVPQAGPSHLPAPGTSRCPSNPQPGPSWACDVNDWASDTSDSMDLIDVRTLGLSAGKRRKT